MEKIPNIGRITSSMDIIEYGNRNDIEKVIPFIYHNKIKEAWKNELEHFILEIDEELK